MGKKKDGLIFVQKRKKKHGLYQGQQFDFLISVYKTMKTINSAIPIMIRFTSKPRASL